MSSLEWVCCLIPREPSVHHGGRSLLRKQGFRNPLDELCARIALNCLRTAKLSNEDIVLAPGSTTRRISAGRGIATRLSWHQDSDRWESSSFHQVKHQISKHEQRTSH